MERVVLEVYDGEQCVVEKMEVLEGHDGEQFVHHSPLHHLLKGPLSVANDSLPSYLN